MISLSAVIGKVGVLRVVTVPPKVVADLKKSSSASPKNVWASPETCAETICKPSGFPPPGVSPSSRSRSDIRWGPPRRESQTIAVSMPYLSAEPARWRAYPATT